MDNNASGYNDDDETLLIPVGKQGDDSAHSAAKRFKWTISSKIRNKTEKG